VAGVGVGGGGGGGSGKWEGEGLLLGRGCRGAGITEEAVKDLNPLFILGKWRPREQDYY
jgi:hypothetical protein